MSFDKKPSFSHSDYVQCLAKSY